MNMKLNDIARQLIGSDPATLVTINRDGSPQVSVVWVTVQSTADGGDELVTAHLQEHQKIRNIRRDIMHTLRELKQEGEVGSDEEHRAETELQKLTGVPLLD